MHEPVYALRWRATLSTLQLVQVTGVAVAVEAVASVVAVAVVVVASVCNLPSCAYRLEFALMRGVAFAGDRGGRGGGFGGGRGGGFGGRGGGRGGFGKHVACIFSCRSCCCYRVLLWFALAGDRGGRGGRGGFGDRKEGIKEFQGSKMSF